MALSAYMMGRALRHIEDMIGKGPSTWKQLDFQN